MEYEEEDRPTAKELLGFKLFQVEENKYLNVVKGLPRVELAGLGVRG